MLKPDSSNATDPVHLRRHDSQLARTTLFFASSQVPVGPLTAVTLLRWRRTTLPLERGILNRAL